jgi:hypothetical protein
MEPIVYSVLKNEEKLKCLFCNEESFSISSWNREPICWDCIWKGKDVQEPSYSSVLLKQKLKEKIMNTNNRITKECTVCGAGFETSKFTPYITECKLCKKERSKVEQKDEVTSEQSASTDEENQTRGPGRPRKETENSIV